MENFCNLNCLESLIQKPTGYKNPSQPTCIDLILTNRPSYFQHSEVFETNLSDFHLLTVTELKMYFNNLNTSKVTDNRTFWKTVVPLFTNKPSRGAKIILKEGNKNILNDSELCKVFNTYFSNIVASLNIPSVNNYITSEENANKFPQQIKCFETHPSIATNRTDLTVLIKKSLSRAFNKLHLFSKLKLLESLDKMVKSLKFMLQ